MRKTINALKLHQLRTETNSESYWSLRFRSLGMVISCHLRRERWRTSRRIKYLHERAPLITEDRNYTI